MTTSDAFALRRTGLDPFLFGVVGDEGNGMALSMISVFARLGQDPWREAGILAGLNASEAVAKLSRTIAAMPSGLWSSTEATAIATRLVTLLPQPGSVVQRVLPVQERSVQILKYGLMIAAVLGVVVYMTGSFGTAVPSTPDISGISSFGSVGPPPPLSSH